MRSNDWSNNEKVQRWLSARPTRNKVVEYLRDGFDSGDMYGSTISCLFAIADRLSEIAPELVPAEWEFSPAMGGADTEAYDYQTIIEAMNNGATVEDLLKAGIIFNRLDNLNRSTGIDY